ncbi:glycosyltransferase family 2 protein (plasmid) [Haloferax sp. S1W]|uniref:glycosyltransferase family 2 protein n=1 Tax=Haloferax sp. S1W TaxID=3377110 RepID=UPI0037CBCEFB
MYLGKTVAVVVPGYNEERFVGEVIATLPEIVDRAYVVDDYSDDGTWHVIREHADRANAARAAPSDTAADDRTPNPPGTVGDDLLSSAETLSDGGSSAGTFVVPIRHKANLGRGAAVKTGYRAALDDGFDIIAVMDADGQMDPAKLEDIIAPVARGEAVYAVGNRLSNPSSWAGMPLHRLFGNVLLTLLTCIASGYWHIRDPQNGYTAIDSEALAVVSIDSLYDDYGFLNDLLVRLSVADLPVVNVPMRARYGDEESGIDYRSFIPKLSTLLLKGFLWRLWRKYVPTGHPVVVSYVAGAIVAFLGLLGVLRSLVRLSTPSSRSLQRTMVGILGLVFAMVLDWRESHRRGIRGSTRRRD